MKMNSAATPTVAKCLQCQLLGRRRLTCSRITECSELPHAYFLGPILLLGWAVTAIAFLVVVS